MSQGQAAHFGVCSPSASADVSTSLITALDNENVSIHSGSWDENATEFYATLIGCVADLHNPRGAHALVGAIDTGWGAIDGVLRLGDAAVPEVAKALKDPSSRTTVRSSAATALGAFIGPRASKPVSAANRTLIRQSLLAALTDKHPLVRSRAVGALAAFPDVEVRNAVAAAAASDTGWKAGSLPRKFLVKDAAREWLRQDSLKIKKHDAPPLP